MPTYPTPGRAISTQGLNKDQGWGSRTPGGQVIAGHAGDQGIAHTAGLSKLGLDTNNNPIISATSVTAITGTGATINWTTVVSQPNGVVRFRNVAVGGAYTTVNEVGGPRSAHTVPITGLTAGAIYEYEVTQPSTDGKNQTVYRGRITAGLAEEPQNQPMAPQLGNTTGITDSRDLLAGGSTTTNESAAPPFEITGLQATAPDPDEMTVTWRTGVYADGTVMYRPYDGAAQTADELGVKRLNHSVTLTGLTPDTDYEVAVISADAQGNTAEGGPIRVRTPAA